MATISSVLADHMTLHVRSLDRPCLQGYVPRLMTQGQVIRFLLDRGFFIPAPAALGKIGREYVNQINDEIVRNDIPTVHFVKGDVKEEIAREHFKAAERGAGSASWWSGSARRRPPRGAGGVMAGRTSIRISSTAVSRSF